MTSRISSLLASSSMASTPFEPSAPDVASDLDDQAKLGGLLIGCEHVALDGRGEAALRGQAELVERDVPGRLVDPPLDHVGVLQLAALAGNQAEHDHLARRHEPQRLEPAR